MPSSPRIGGQGAWVHRRNVRGYEVFLEPDPDEGGYVVRCPSLSGCYTQGDTVEEAIGNIEEAILLCLEDTQQLKES